MCGVVGVTSQKNSSPDFDFLRPMTQALRHRGPDAEGFYQDARLGFGHRRLAIVDTDPRANQPFYNSSKSIISICNGEFYNYKEIRNKLEQNGFVFKTNCDNEILPFAWEAWGEDCLKLFRGMYAFAIYDRAKGHLFLARDRMGQKPMYYHRNKGLFLFASEIKALFKYPSISREIDYEAFTQYATYGYVLGQKTIYKSIQKLPPASSLLLDLNTSSDFDMQIKNYWRLEELIPLQADPEEALSIVENKIIESVNLRLMSDVPLGVCLSSGIDSGLIAAFMARSTSSPIQTFTIGFEDDAYDETEGARIIAEHLGGKHHTETVKALNLKDTLDLITTFDEPFGDPSALPTYKLSQMVKKHVTVALSGDGGDELFLGYSRYLEAFYDSGQSRFKPAWLRNISEQITHWWTRPMPGVRALERWSSPEYHHYNHKVGFKTERLAWLRKECAKFQLPQYQQKMAQDFDCYPQMPLLKKYQRTDLMNYLPDNILIKVDRTSMAHALEMRNPFLDHELVELACRIPWQLNAQNNQGKIMLRTLAKKYLPKEVAESPKKGFGIPLNRWFAEDLRQHIVNIISDEKNAIWQYYHRQHVERRFEEHLCGFGQHGPTLWRLFIFYHWLNHENSD